MADRFDLHRFVDAQAGGVYERALGEILAGRKRTHWMWFVFPQLTGLGVSDTARFYGITCAEEARAYLRHEILRPRLSACAEAVLAAPGTRADEIFGMPDDLKLRSSATLFAAMEPEGSVFEMILRRFWGGEPDSRTIELLA